MKKTLSVNIGSVGFTMDEDAFQVLNSYYEDIRSRLYDTDKQEIMDDIESRTADIFRENMAFPSQVVDMDLVKKAIAVIGSAQTFGERRYDPDFNPQGGPQPISSRKLYRSRTDSVIAGVCGGLANYLNIDTTVIRLLMFIFLIFGGATFWAYIIMWIVVPLEPVDNLSAGNYRNGRRNRR